MKELRIATPLIFLTMHKDEHCLYVEDLAEEIAECGDGEEVVAAYAAQQFGVDDRVLMDLQMPRVGGLEATRQLLAAFPEAQIIIVTQYDDPYWWEAAQRAGACGYVLKENLLDLRLLLQAGVKLA